MNALTFEPGAFEMKPCNVCGAPFLRVLGVLGSRVWYRCDGCGADVAGGNVDATRAAVARAADVSEIIDGAEPGADVCGVCGRRRTVAVRRIHSRTVRVCGDCRANYDNANE